MTFYRWKRPKENKQNQTKQANLKDDFVHRMFFLQIIQNLIITEPESTGVKGITCSCCNRHINFGGILRSI